MNERAKSIAKNIKQYIDFFAASEVKSKGKKLFEVNAVTLQEYDEIKDTWHFTVKGTLNYSVKIKGTQSFVLDTSCNCPYEWGSVCKHRVAALYYIVHTISKGENPLAIAALIRSSTRFGELSGYPIDSFQNISKQFVENNTFSRVMNESLYGRRFLSNTVVIIKPNEIDFVTGDESYNVTFYRVGASVYITSLGAENSQKLTLAEALCLIKIANSPLPNVLEKIFSGEIKEKESEFLATFGLPHDTNFDEYFEYCFSEKSGLFYNSKSKAQNLLPINPANNYFLNLIDELNNKQNILDKLTKNQDREIGFILKKRGEKKSYYDYKDEDYFEDEQHKNELRIVPIIAKTNKAGTQFASHITEYETHYEKEFQIRKSNSLNELLKQIDSYDNLQGNNDEEQFRLKQKMFKLLQKQKFVFDLVSDNKGIKKNNLQAIELSGQALDIQFKVSKNKEFIFLSQCLQLGEEAIKARQINSDKSDDSIYFINGKYHLVKNHNVSECLNKFPDKLKMVKSASNEFYNNVIEPISRNFKINYSNGTFKNETVELDFNKKQIFLSEKNEHIVFTPQVEYDNDVSVVLNTNGNTLLKNGKLITEYVRNFELEDDFIEQIAAVHPKFEEQKNNKLFYLHYSEFMENMWFYKFFDYLQHNNIELYGLKDLKKFKYSPHKGKISTSLTSEQDWFEVNVEVRFGDNQVGLKDIKKAIINKQRYIQLNDGSVGILPSEWFQKLEKYFRNGEIRKDKLEISKLRFSIVDELFDNIDDTEIMLEITTKRQRLLQFNEITKTNVPKQIKANLRPYQKEGLNWLNFLDEMQWGGILADDMGLGKTLQVLTFLQQQVNKKKASNLIVVPTTLLFNWKNEIKKFAPKLKAHYYYGTDRIKDTKIFKDYHLVFTTYGILLRDIEILSQFKFNYVILDESQAIKNPVSRRYKAANLLDAKNRIALTGTPIENGTFDLFAQMNFANRGFFGGAKNFKENYSNPIDKDGSINIANELQRIINPFILRRTKEKVASELPAKTEDIIYCEMESGQRKIYDAYRNEYKNQLLNKIEDEGIGKSKMMVLEALTRLRQICDSPILLKADDVSETESVKTKEICRHITNKTGQHKILVFSQFVGMLSIVKNELRNLNIEFEYLDGKNSTKQREQSVNNFQNNNDLRVFLISLKAGGTGLNLTAADYVYILDPWWNPAVESQAIDRCYRIGQDKKVFAYRMICKDTVEEKILLLQNKKKKIAGDIIQTDENIMKKLNVNDIKELFS